MPDQSFVIPAPPRMPATPAMLQGMLAAFFRG